MPNTQIDAVLTFTVDGADYACQLLTPSFTPAWAGEGDLLYPACGGAVEVDPPEQAERGSITGEALKDTLPDGLTRVLLEKLGQQVPFTYVENPGELHELSIDGEALITPFTLGWRQNRLGRHDINLTVLSQTVAAATTP